MAGISFRKEALDHLTSPEQLDRTVPILRPMDWLIGIAFLVMFSSLGVWSIVGELTKRVPATGLLINSEGRIFDAMSVSGGVLGDLKVGLGDVVEKGQVIGDILQSEVRQQLDIAEEALQRRRGEFAETEQQLLDQDKISKDFYNKQAQRLREQISLAQKVVQTSRNQLEDYRKLLESQSGTRAGLRSQQQAYDQAVANLSRLNDQLEQREKQELDRQHQARTRMTRAKEAVIKAEDRIAELNVRLADSTAVKAPIKGRIIELKANPGSSLRPGLSVASIETLGETLEMIGYIPPQHSGKVKVGQEVLVSVGTDDDASGSRMLGEVRQVSEFPVSEQGIMVQLQNAALARSLIQAGAPYEVRIALDRDETSANGYAWTSKKGRQKKTVASGTFCSAKIVHDKVKPISMVVPLTKEFFGIEN
ncbi:MAG: NHLP bacteriocin system secretion protein [Gammaproteobacteria bacterium]|nr:NHLP bacteriocin system secretion protein [Gammaproteobacteria bacterium]MDD9886341.1 NHLP bacteriocin system secretion protein [Gammaproteobacteria bacterium]